MGEILMKSNTLDRADQQILDILIENSRTSLIEIADRVGLSRVAVKNRMDVLEQKGVIERYTIVLNPEKVGRNVSVFFDLQVQPAHLREVADRLIEEEAVTDVYLMTGPGKLHVHAVLEMNQDLEHFVLEKLYPLPGIEHISSDIIVSRIKTRKGIRI
jgi:Lrp/AsnC family leucine-responsive transcriptional regulator